MVVVVFCAFRRFCVLSLCIWGVRVCHFLCVCALMHLRAVCYVSLCVFCVRSFVGLCVCVSEIRWQSG